MIYFLVILFIIGFALYYSASRSFTSPFSLMMLSFIMALTLIMCNIDNWQVRINPHFIVYILLSVAAFAIGCFVADVTAGRIVIGGGGRCILPTTRFERRGFSKVVFVVLPVLCAMLYVALAIRMALSSGLRGSLLRMIYSASAANTSSFFFHQLREIVVAIAEVSIIIVFKSAYVDHDGMPKLLVIPIICFAFCTVFSTDRNIFLRFIIYSICIWIFFKSSTSQKNIRSTNKQILKKTLLILIVAIALFYLLGKIKSYTSNLERMIGIYGGSGLYNFNLSIEKFEGWTHEHGLVTFSQLISTLKVFGINLWDSVNSVAGLGMVEFSSPNGYVYASNIYSAMAPYFMDFGVMGLVIFPFVLGLIFKKLYRSAIKKGSFYNWGIYSLLVYAVVYFTIGEQFFMRFHLGLVYELAWFSIIYFLAFGSKNFRITM